MKNFKYCAIALNILHTGGLCGVLRFTAPLILISKKFQSKHIYTLNSALRSPIARAAIKQLLLGALHYPNTAVAVKGDYKCRFFNVHQSLSPPKVRKISIKKENYS